MKLKLKLIETECKKNKISRYNYLISCNYSLKFIDYCIIGLSSIEEFIKLKKFKPKKIDLDKINSFYVNDKKIISDKEDEIFNCNDKEKQITHIMSSGLNNLIYKIINRENLIYNIELIQVSI